MSGRELVQSCVITVVPMSFVCLGLSLDDATDMLTLSVGLSVCQVVPMSSVCLGLSLDDATDTLTLSVELDKADRQLRELMMSERTRYATQDHCDQLKTELRVSVDEKLRAQADVDRLRRQERLIRAALDAAQAYLNVELPQQTVGDFIIDNCNAFSTTGM